MITSYMTCKFCGKFSECTAVDLVCKKCIKKPATIETKHMNQILDFFSNKKGFDWWWEDIDGEIKSEIKRELKALLVKQGKEK